MITLHIYGDSFASALREHPHSWSNLVASQTDLAVTNCAVPGTGPEYSITRLRDRGGGDCAVFMFSYVRRLNLKNYWASPKDQVRMHTPDDGFTKQLNRHLMTWSWEQNQELGLMLAAGALLSQRYTRSILWPCWPLTQDPQLYSMIPDSVHLAQPSLMEQMNLEHSEAEACHLSSSTNRKIAQTVCDFARGSSLENPLL